MTMERPSSGPWSSVGSSIIILSVSSSPRVSREITAGQKVNIRHRCNTQFMEYMREDITCDGVQLHSGVVVRHRFRLVRRLEDRSQSWRRDVGNLQGQRGLVETQTTTNVTEIKIKNESWERRGKTDYTLNKSFHGLFFI